MRAILRDHEDLSRNLEAFLSDHECDAHSTHDTHAFGRRAPMAVIQRFSRPVADGHHYKGSDTQTQTAGYSAHSDSCVKEIAIYYDRWEGKGFALFSPRYG